MADKNAKTVGVVLKIGDVVVPTNEVMMLHGIGNLPMVAFKVQLDNSVKRGSNDTAVAGSAEIDVDLYTRLMRAIQEKVLNDYELDYDVVLSVSDGDGNEIVFRGQLNTPQLSVESGLVRFSMSAEHQANSMSMFSPYIYAPIRHWAASGTNYRNASPIQTAKIILDKFYDTYQQRLAGFDTPTGINQLRESPFFNIHNLNVSAKQYVDSFMEESYLWTEIPGLDDESFHSEKLAGFIADTYRSSPTFMHAVRAFENAFMLQMNAKWDTTAWLERIQTFLDPGQREIILPIRGINLSTGRSGAPLLQVLVQSDTAEFYTWDNTYSPTVQSNAPLVQPPEAVLSADDVVFAQASLKSVGGYPYDVPSDARGRFEIVQAPQWLDTVNLDAAQVTESRRRSAGDDFVIAKQNTDDQKIGNLRYARNKQRVLDYMAEYTFKDLYLKYSTTTVTGPFNVAAQTGRTYLVKNHDGKEIFTGFLSNIQHTISLSEGPNSTGQAVTIYTFSHIIVADANIKAITNPA